MIYGTGKTRIRLARLCLSTILCTGLAAPAAAQIAPTYRNLDANGVDLTHGDYVMGLVEGTIGSGEQELALVRDGPWLSGYNGHRWDSVMLNEFSVNRSVSFGGRTEWFNGSTSQQANGSTLTLVGGTFVHRAADGTTTEFSPRDPNCSPTSTQACTWIPASIASPDGKAVSLSYEQWLICPDVPIGEEVFCTIDSVRLNQIANNAGYSIAFTYAADGSGGNSGPHPDWHRRTRADFYNSAVGSGSQGNVTYAYPATNITDVTDMAGRSWRISGAGSIVSAIRRPGASSDTTTINRSFGIVTSVARDGITTNYSRSVSGSTATTVVTNALSQATTIVSDMTIGRPTSVTNALSQTTGYQYDSYGRLTQVTYPEGNQAVYAYDARGNVTSTTLKAKSGSGLADIVTTASYPSTCSNPVTCNSPEWTRDAKGNQTDYTYDATHGGILTVTSPADAGGVRPQTRYTYTLTGGVYLLTGVSACQAGASCAGAASEAKTAIAYSTNSLPSSVTQSAGDGSISSTTAVTYDPKGDVKTVDGPLAGAGDTTTYRYDAGRRLTGVVGPDPDGGGSRKPTAQRMTYGNDGLTLKEVGIVDDAGDTAWAAFSSQEQAAVTYDANARPVKSELKSGGTTYAVSQTSYDAVGHIDCSVQRMNPATFGSLPSACSLATAGSDGPDRIAKTIYDAVGRTAKVQVAYGTAAQADETTVGYTDNGYVSRAIDAENNRTAYTYDGHDRLVTTNYPLTTKGANGASGTDYEQLTYDANGNVTSRRLRDGTSIGYGYDNLNRMVSKDLPGSEPDATFSYDLLGRPLTAVQGSEFQYFGYNALGHRLYETLNFGTINYSYDAAGRRASLAYPGSALTINYDHDVTGNVTAIRENGATSGVGVLASYAFDNLGRRTGVTFGNGSVQSFAYDPVSRLSSLTNDLGGGATTHDLTQSFSYNPASQIASATRSNDAYAWQAHYNVDRAYVADGLNRITSAGGTSLGYDARGNLTTSGSNSYGYTSENLMTTGPGGFLAGYDPLGRLKWTATAATGSNYFIHDGTMLIAELNASGNPTRRYVHGPGIGNPIVWYEGATIDSTTRRFLMADERGSVVSVTDSSNVTIAINSYDEYGIPAPGNAGRFGYTGQTLLPEVGLWYYKARMYSPTLGRFMQTDPIGYSDGMNWYNYVGSDPVNFVDPLGLCGLSMVPDGKGDPGSTEWSRAGNKCPPGASSGGGANIWFRGSILGEGGGIGDGPQGDSPLQPADEDPCETTLHKVGDAFEAGGDGVTYAGLTIAAIGSPAGLVGMAPGLVIAEIGGIGSAGGQAFQDVAFAREPKDYAITALRGIANVAGGRVVTSIYRLPGHKLADAISGTAVGSSVNYFFGSLDPQRCPND